MGSNDGENFDTLSEKKTLTTATSGLYSNDIAFEVETPYKYYKISFIDGGKNGITGIWNVGGCWLREFKFLFK